MTSLIIHKLSEETDQGKCREFFYEADKLEESTFGVEVRALASHQCGRVQTPASMLYVD